MKKKLLLIILVAFCSFPSVLFAQQGQQAGNSGAQNKKANKTMHGVVTDEYGALAGATIYLQNKDQRIVIGAITGLQGEYLLNIPTDAEDLMIVTSFVGCETVKVAYKGQRIYNVHLLADSKTLETVVVEAKTLRRNNMGVNKENLGTSSEFLDISDLGDMSVTSVTDMLQGKLANLDIVSASGDPGATSTIRIRGSASLNASNEPLIVIDGVPQDNEVDEDFNFASANVEDFGTMLNIAPSDIQSIEVLKDAAATALWGPRAANGVLIITTKRGGRHKPRFSFSQKLNYSFEPKALPLLNGQEYVTLMQDALWNYVKDGNFSQDRMKLLSSYKDILYDRSYEYFNEFNCNTDWLDLISRNTLNATTDFSMDGGGDIATYRFSLGYEDQDGTTKGFDYQRITSRLNLNIRFSEKFRVESRFSYVESDRNQPFGQVSQDLAIGADNNELNAIYDVNDQIRKPVRNTAMIKMPNMSPWVLDKSGMPTDEYFSAPENSLQGVFPNPLAHVYESTNHTKLRSVSANFAVVYRPFSGFTVNGNIAYTLSAIRNNGFLPSSVLNVKWANKNYNQGVEAQANKAVTFADIKLIYEKTINKKHATTTSFSNQINATDNNSYSISTAGSGAEEVSSPSSEGKIISMASAWNKRREIGLVGSSNYVYDERYAFTLAGRMNANSNTGKNSRWTSIRPSISAVWRAKNEKFLKKVKLLNDWRVRASWGQSDRVPNSNYTTGTFAYEDSYMDRPSIKPNRMQLDDLKPEVVTTYNLGTDISFWKNKVNLTLEYYNKKTSDLLMQNMGIQSSTGYNTIKWYNAGNIVNNGWEIILNLNNIVTAGDFKVSLTNVNISRNKNKITSMPDNLEAEKYTIGNGQYARKIMEGNPIGSIYGLLFDGLYQNEDETLARDANGALIRDINGNTVPIRIDGTTRMRPGDTKYRDLNHDGVIDERDVVYLGSSFPTITGGATLLLNYKVWTLRTTAHFRLGHSIVNMVRHDLEKMNNGNNQLKNVQRRWRYEGDETDVPRALWGINYNSIGSSKFVEDGSFMKIKDITLSYKLSQKFCKKLGLSRGTASITTYNLITITNYSGQDPEVGVGNGAYGLAIDNNRTPPSRRVAFSVSFDF